MTHFGDGDIQRICESNPIAEVVAEHGVPLTVAEQDNMTAPCPFPGHEGEGASFNVTPARGYWYCFGCGEGGDVITFMRKACGLTYPDAVQHLAARAGIKLTGEGE